MGNATVRFTTLVCLALVLGGCNCGKDKVVATTCRQDSDCEAGYLCENFTCVPESTKACDMVLNGNPLVQATPHLVAFGDLDTTDAKQTITLYNLGNCTLTLYEAAIVGQASHFTCTECGQGMFPMEIFPNRSRTLEVTFHTDTVGAFSDSLNILSDDREYPEMKIPVHARYIGSPKLAVAPNPVDFGYVAQGRLLRKQLTVTNTGSGTAPVTITAVAFVPATQDFELTAPPTLPLTLAPVSTDRNAITALELQYHPRSNTRHLVDLVFTTDKGEVLVPVRGTAETPPKVTISPLSVDLGNVPLGTSNVATLTIVNEGGAPLQTSYLWGGTNPSTDLWASPTVVPDVIAGEYTELKVAVTATAVGLIQGMLVIKTNDPSKPSVTIPVSAMGVAGAGPEVVKVEMNFENGSDSVFDNDMRNVDMSLEHPYGYVCNKQNANPTTWGVYGTPSWIAFGPKEEPERIILADSQHDGTYRVMVQYMEDCSSLPTTLLAGILGISVDVLVTYLTGGAGGLINGQDVSQLIANICLSHSRTGATVRVYVNGTLVKESTVGLGAKGDTTYAVDLVRTNGNFTAR